MNFKKGDKVVLVVICGPKKVNEIMDSFGLGTKGKIFGMTKKYELDLKEDTDAERLLEETKKAISDDGNIIAYMRYSTEHQENGISVDNSVSFRDEEIQFISNGKEFCSLDDLIKVI